MRGDASAYAALGLEPGADAATIDRAYRSLIKIHHPDREGGDALRAAEINRAYRELRGRPAPVDAFSFDDHGLWPPNRQSGGWVAIGIAVAVASMGLLVAAGPGEALIRDLVGAPPHEIGSRGTRPRFPIDKPIDGSRIEQAVQDAVVWNAKGDSTALLSASRDCHRDLRARPSVEKLDRCAAFDDAVVELQDMDPTWDGGPFSQPAVTRRQWAAASALSNDYLAVDTRLDRIRLQVELALAPHKPAEDRQADGD